VTMSRTNLNGEIEIKYCFLFCSVNYIKSLILAQDERWRRG
jgi:hypothetical protein